MGVRNELLWGPLKIMAAIILICSAFIFIYVRSTSIDYHVLYAAQDYPLVGAISRAYLETCPEIEEGYFKPNSVIGFVLAGIKDKNRRASEQVIMTLIHCGVPLDQCDDIGLTPVQSAILYRDVTTLEFLHRLGADFTQPVAYSIKKYAGLSPAKFARKLQSESRNKERYGAVISYLENARPLKPLRGTCGEDASLGPASPKGLH
jgi:hypothetical protein